jgi:tRNA(Ile)-lysidine synthase
MSEGGDLLIDRARFAAADEEIRLRLLSRAIGWVSASHYPPRLSALSDAADAVSHGGRRTLGGATLTGGARRIRVAREYQAVRALVARPGAIWDGAIWDGRWRITGPFVPDDEVRALGPEGLAELSGRPRGVPAGSLWSTPAVFRGGRLVAAPVAAPGGIWRAEAVPGGFDAFVATFAH